MNFKTTVSLVHYVLILIAISTRVQSSRLTSVPVLIWTTHQQTLPSSQWPSKSSVAQIDSNVFKDDYLNQWPSVVAFIQNNISIEHFSLPNHFKTWTEIINDKSQQSIFLTDVLNPIDSLNEFTVQDIDNLNINDGNKVMINLPHNTLYENEQLISHLWHQIRPNVSENTIYLISGRYGDEDFYDNEDNRLNIIHHRFRRATKDDDRLVSIDNCLYFYMKSLKIVVNSIDPNYPISSTSFNSLEVKPTLGESKCWQSNDTKEPAILDLTYSSSETKVHFKFVIKRNIRNGFWRISNGLAFVTLPSKEEIKYELRVNEITAEDMFSYSCSQLKISSLVNDESSKYAFTQLILKFKNFQLQPFDNPLNKMSNNKVKYVFTASSDCQVWMSLPLWMGFFTLILFTIILLIGVYFLWRINSPDRFENPKGKPLIISSSDE
ncbi:uncharacterized protein LOC128966437 [Oppia nitens]|uniref:uncharacterized protein LOC128966437 n=1 Tax=Oppia nitens TaxID=1686743 RepID=UPI0023DB3925|nr:uncharacterized protein LOC128966437 [Oppia nitens]